MAGPIRNGSFHTTLAALEALQLCRPSAANQEALARGREFFLVHRVCHSHRTGKLVKPSFLSFPPPLGWQFDGLRGLEHFADAGAPRDTRLAAVVELVRRRADSDGRWSGPRPPAGSVHFALERASGPSRWLTLRCLRVLRWWDAGAAQGDPDPDAAGSEGREFLA